MLNNEMVPVKKNVPSAKWNSYYHPLYGSWKSTWRRAGVHGLPFVQHADHLMHCGLIRGLKLIHSSTVSLPNDKAYIAKIKT